MTPAQKRLQAQIDTMIAKLEQAVAEMRRLKAENQDLREAIREIRYMAKI